MNEGEARLVESSVPPVSPSARATLHEIASSAIRFWEPCRVIYNAVLALVVAGNFVAAWPASRTAVNVEHVLPLFVLAVLANVFYCAAYIADVFAQYSDLRPLWLRWRWVLLVTGIAFAATLTQFIAADFFDAVDFD